MRTIAFVGGQELIRNGVPIKLVRVVGNDGSPIWEYENQSLMMRERASQLQLELEHGAGTLFSADPEEARGKRDGVKLLSDMGSYQQKLTKWRRAIVDEVDRLTVPGNKTSAVIMHGKRQKDTVLDALLVKLGREIGIKILGKPRPASRASYYRWRKERHAPVNKVRKVREPLGPGVRKAVKEAIRKKVLEHQGPATKPGEQRLTMKELKEVAVKAVDAERSLRPFETLKVPSEPVFYRIKDEIPKVLLDTAFYGRVRTKRDYRRPSNSPNEITYCLQRVEFDETRCPIFLYLDDLFLPLGRPWLAWIVDVFSHCIIGFYIGFDPPCDLVISQTLKHACLPKPYIHERFPSIKNPSFPSGVPHFITFDNSMTAHGGSVDAICGDLDIKYDFQTPREPWMKGFVEESLGTIERALLAGQPGYQPPRGWEISPVDYDPGKTAATSFNTFVTLIYAYLCDYHNPLTRQMYAGRSPMSLWEEGTARVRPRYPSRALDLDALFGVVRQGRRLGSNGVVYEGMRYYSDEMHDERLFDGPVQYVDVKVNPLDLRKIHFKNSKNTWIPAVTKKYPELEYLNLHAVELLGKQSRQLYGSETMEDRVRAMMHVREIGRLGYDEGMSHQNAARAARLLGISSLERNTAPKPPLLSIAPPEAAVLTEAPRVPTPAAPPRPEPRALVIPRFNTRRRTTDDGTR